MLRKLGVGEPGQDLIKHQTLLIAKLSNIVVECMQGGGGVDLGNPGPIKLIASQRLAIPVPPV